MTGAGSSLMGQGTGTGKTRARDAALAATSSPLLDVGIERARGIVWNVTGPPDMSLAEVNAAAEVRGCLFCLERAGRESENKKTIEAKKLNLFQKQNSKTPEPSKTQKNVQKVVYDLVDPEANLIFGAVVDPALAASGELSITLIATGFGEGGLAGSAVAPFISSRAPVSSSAPRDVASATAAAAAAELSMPAVSASAASSSSRGGLGIEIPAFLRRRRAK
jgi:cell division protein FtsZ